MYFLLKNKSKTCAISNGDLDCFYRTIFLVGATVIKVEPTIDLMYSTKIKKGVSWFQIKI